MLDTYTLYTDGGSRGNPGPAGIGFVLETNGETSCQGGAFIGTTTNNVAEYRALIWGVENALAHDVDDLSISCDSELLVKQLLGEYRVKNADLKPLFLELNALLRKFDSWKARHIPREENVRADALANEAMDAKDQVGEPCVDFLLPPISEQLTIEEVSSEAWAAKSAPSSGRYELTVRDHFDAAHHLYDYPGQCRNLHGHTWDVEVTVASSSLNELGMVYDFAVLKEDLKAVLDVYDHADLNVIPPFDTISPTAENLARIICEALQRQITQPGVIVSAVVVWESPIAKLVYRPR